MNAGSKCYRVPVLYYRRDASGLVLVVERDGPIISADSAPEAKERAETICSAFPDFASIGEATLLHERAAHRHMVPPPLTRELRPVARTTVTLDESLLQMVAAIRARQRGRLDRGVPRPK